jgi:hypothetical protein
MGGTQDDGFRRDCLGHGEESDFSKATDKIKEAIDTHKKGKP